MIDKKNIIWKKNNKNERLFGMFCLLFGPLFEIADHAIPLFLGKRILQLFLQLQDLFLREENIKQLLRGIGSVLGKYYSEDVQEEKGKTIN